MDVLVPQPEVPADAAEALLVLPPVLVEGDQAALASLNDGPAPAYHLHVTEHLRQRGCSGQGPSEAGAWVDRTPFSWPCRARDGSTGPPWHDPAVA